MFANVHMCICLNICTYTGLDQQIKHLEFCWSVLNFADAVKKWPPFLEIKIHYMSPERNMVFTCGRFGGKAFFSLSRDCCALVWNLDSIHTGSVQICIIDLMCIVKAKRGPKTWWPLHYICLECIEMESWTKYSTKKGINNGLAYCTYMNATINTHMYTY